MTEPRAEADWNGDGAARIKQALSLLMPHLRPFWNKPLQDYAHAIYDTAPLLQPSPSERVEALFRLRACIERVAIRSGTAPAEAASAGEQLTCAPIIQTGPHCLLLLDPDAFYTHLFGLLGLGAHGLRWQIWCSASTVKFIEKPRKGPGWLPLEGEAVNVFGLPRRRMDSFNICGTDGRYRFSFSKDRAGEPANASAARLKSALPQQEFGSAADAIKAANKVLWERRLTSSIRLLQFDDIDVADLWADHLEDAGSWLSRYFFGEKMLAETVLEILDDLNAGPWAGWIRTTTDLFWGLVGGRIIPLRLRDGILRDETERLVRLPFTRDHVAAALRRRQLVPNLLAMVMVISILPGVRILGGCRQVIYYPLMRNVVSAALGILGGRSLKRALSTDVLPGVWGHRVLKPDHGDPFGELEARNDPLTLIEPYRLLPLATACGDLASFTNDRLWKSMYDHIELVTIDPDAPEWPWASLS